MRHPPYHLRSNKAVDRYLFVEILRKILLKGPASSRYTYIGFGGPFLEDFKLLDQYFPEMRYVSVENDPETYKRQKAHRFNKRIKLQYMSAEDYVRDMSDDSLVALWFDYVGLDRDDIAVFADAVTKSAPWSVLRLTLNSSFNADPDFRLKFEREFERLLPQRSELDSYFSTQYRFECLLIRILERATLSPIGSQYDFKLLSAATYRDGARMITITGIKASNEIWNELRSIISRWPLTSNGWLTSPMRINVPELSLHERLRLAGALPTSSTQVGRRLTKRLGYCVAGTVQSSDAELSNYSLFHRYFPVFAKLGI